MSPTATATAATAATTAAPAAAPPATRGDLSGSTAESLLLIVSPGNGRFQPLVTAGRADAGTVVARITGGRGAAVDVPLPADACVAGLLALPGHLVTRGQALAWARLEPADAAA